MNTSPHHWTPLIPGDIIDIIAPASGVETHQMKRVTAFVKTFGFTPRIHKDICGSTPYYAHEDNYRLTQLLEALSAPDSKAVWCLRGGYGCTRLIPKLLAAPAPEICKLVIGFSDITALHLVFNQHWHWPTLHAPVLFQAIENLVDDVSLAALKNILLGTVPDLTYTPLIPLNAHAKCDGRIQSSIIGGNLSLLVSSLGTDWQLRPSGQILFIEEVSERGYRIDRMLTHLSHAHVLDHVKAILFGDIIGGDEQNGSNFVTHALTSFAAHCPVPVLQCKLFGHGKRNLPLPLYTAANLTLGRGAALTCKTGAAL